MFTEDKIDKPFSVEFALGAWGFMLDFFGIVHRGAFTLMEPPRLPEGMRTAASLTITGTLQNSGGPFSAQILGTSRGWLWGPLMLKTGREREGLLCRSCDRLKIRVIKQ